MRLPRLLPRSGSPLERFLRALALMAVLAGVLWAFEARFSRLAEDMAREQTVYDETGQLTADERGLLRALAGELHARFGLDVAVRVQRGAVTVPALDEKTVFIGLCVDAKTATVILPPLAVRALGAEFPRTIENDILGQALASGRWPEGLVAALVFLEQQLSGESRTGEGS